MNNLKRVLSMALASVMLIGMMAVGASAADFTDADKIQYGDAVDILVALKVINGKPDGSFDPEGDVTRAEMAKMISVAMNGGNEANADTKDVPSFSDIGGHWAEAQIEYCTNLKIIAGRGDGTFAPEQKVTGLEAAKMVLTALGYDATAYQLIGDSWSSRTDELARGEANLYELLAGVQMAKPASREVAAQLIWNGLQSTTRKVKPSTALSTGEVTWDYSGEGDTLLFERYGAQIWTGTYDGNDKNSNAKAGEIKVTRTTTTVDNDNGTVSTKSNPAYVPSDLGIENMGEEIKVIWKEGTNGGSASGKPDSKDTIYGVFNTGATEVIWTTRSLIKDNMSDEAQINVNGDLYDLADSVAYYVNYTATPAQTFKKGQLTGEGPDGEYDGRNSEVTAFLQHGANSTGVPKTGDRIKLVCTDGVVTAAYVEESFIGVITATSNGKVTVSSKNAIGTITLADHDVYDGAAKGDVVVVKSLYSTNMSEAYHVITKADVVSGTVNSVNGSETVVVDGASYSIYNHSTLFTNGALAGAVNKFDADSVGEDFDLYLVNGYVGAAVQTSEGNNNYSVIIRPILNGRYMGDVAEPVQVVVKDADGVITTLTLSEESYYSTGSGTTKITNELMRTYLKEGSIVTYSTDKNGDAELLVEGLASTSSDADTVAYNFDTKKLKITNGGYTRSYTVNSDTILFANEASSVSGTSMKAYSLRDMGTNPIASRAGEFEGKTFSYVLNADGIVKAVYMDLGYKPAGAKDNTVYGIVTQRVGDVTPLGDGVKYVQFKVASNEEVYEVNLTTAAARALEGAGLKKGSIVRLDPTADKTYTADDVQLLPDLVSTGSFGDGSSYQVGYSKEHNEADGTITIYKKILGTVAPFEGDDAETYPMDEKANIFYVDQLNDTGALGGIGEFDTINGLANIIVVYDKEGVVTAVIYETSARRNITNPG